MRRSLLRTERRAASVGCAVKTGRTLRWRTVCAQVLGVGVLEPVGGAGEEAALGGAAVAQLAAAVDLLGDVGQVEVGGEGADQLGRGLQVGAAEQLGGGLAVLAGEGADLLDEVEELGALLADEGLAQQVAQAADVGAQLGVGRSWWSGRRHCSQVRLLAVLKLVREGTRRRPRGGAASAPWHPGRIRADRAVRPTPRIGVHADAQVGGLLPRGRRAAILTMP